MASAKLVYRSLIHVPGTQSMYFGNNSNGGYETEDINVAMKGAETYVLTHPQHFRDGYTAVVVQVAPEFRIVKISQQPAVPVINWEDADEAE